MEMTIDKTIEFFNGLEGHTPQAKDARDMAIDTMRKYQQLQADYENRLKADLKAILVELQTQMEEYEPKWAENNEQAVASCRTWEDLDDIIQQKINELMAESEG